MIRATGLDIVRYRPMPRYPADFDEATIATIEAVRPFTMTSSARLFALCSAVRYLVRNDIPGALVECGVWRGGSMMAVARTLLEEGDRTRELHLFDTFTGMVEPGSFDYRHDGVDARVLLHAGKKGGESHYWCRASLDDVRRNMETVGYPPDLIHYIQGPVESTLKARGLSAVALLRLDTDWYESTRHELACLFPCISAGGVLIIDDYGFWQGARRAVDEYLDKVGVPILLGRIDHTGRLAVVPGPIPPRH